MNEMKKESTYSAAASELETIVENIEANKYGIDDLSQKVKEAVGLINFMRQKLKENDEQIEKLIKELGEN